jgi:transcriptional regulator
MDEFPFADLVTSTPTIRITHIPVLVDRTAGKYGILYGHVSRQNPQSQVLDHQHSAVVVFHGPHGYISPTWYEKTEAVPTWNFAAVHVSGKPRPVTEKKALNNLLQKLIDRFEKYEGSAYDFSKLPDSYKHGLMAGIVGFELEIDLIEGKFKLGQERSESDKASVLRHLRSANPPRSLHDLTASFYERATGKGMR